MAMRGRFASGGTGGSSLSMLVYNIMRSQYSRQVEAIVSAYQNSTDYMGEGIPSADRVVAFLQEYAARPWLTPYERQNITDQIKRVKGIENQRQGNILVNRINQDPSNADAVREYIAYLQNNIANAETADEKATAESSLLDAQNTLINAIATSLKNGLLSNDQYNAEVNAILSTYQPGSPQYQSLLTSSFEKQWDALDYTEYTKVLNAQSKGDAAYSKALKGYIAWLKSQRSLAASQGLAGVDSSGNIISGSDGVQNIQRTINDMETTLKKLGANMATNAAISRVNSIGEQTAGLLELVNNTLGSNYTNITSFLANQIDLNRFYSTAPSSLRAAAGWIEKDELIAMVFGGRNSLISSAKAGGSSTGDLYSVLAGLGKNYGVRSAVDEAAVLFENYTSAVPIARGDANKLIAATDQLISSYEALIRDASGRISPQELLVHQQTLNALKKARAGKKVTTDGLSAWDLANPFAADYDKATNARKSAFDTVLNLVSTDALNAQALANGAVQIARPSASGGWEFGEVVDPKTLSAQTGGALRLLKNGLGYTAGILEGVPIEYVAPDVPGRESQDPKTIGFYYDLGNGEFQVQDAAGNWYRKNYDPLSGKVMTSNDFRGSYLHSVVTKATGGESTSKLAPTFTVGNQFVALGITTTADGQDNSGRAVDVLTGDLDLDMKKIDRNYDGPTAAKLKLNLINTVTSGIGDKSIADLIYAKYEPQVAAASAPTVGGSGKIPMITGAPGGGGSRPSLSTGSSGTALGYFFRNTPIAPTVTNLGNAVGNIGTGGAPKVTPIKL